MAREELQKQELDLVKRYQGGDRAALSPLMTSLKPVIANFARNVASTNLPKSAIEAEIKFQTIKAIKSFDPNKGVKLSTHINSRLPGTYRLIYEHQNIGRISEPDNIKVGTFKSAQQRLEQKFGRDATTAELADDLGWDMGQVSKVNRLIRKDIAVSDFDFGKFEQNKAADLLHYVYHELDPTEKIVLEHTTGVGGKKILKGKDIAKKLKVSEATVTNIKKRIANRMEGHI
jgi:RNA polymerase nonessential primary-like sigma factor